MLKPDLFPGRKWGNTVSFRSECLGGGQNNRVQWSHITAQCHHGFSSWRNQSCIRADRKRRLLNSCAMLHILTGLVCGHGRLRADNENLHCETQCS